jgi:hypothetical protein
MQAPVLQGLPTGPRAAPTAGVGSVRPEGIAMHEAWCCPVCCWCMHCEARLRPINPERPARGTAFIVGTWLGYVSMRLVGKERIVASE